MYEISARVRSNNSAKKLGEQSFGRVRVGLDALAKRVFLIDEASIRSASSRLITEVSSGPDVVYFLVMRHVSVTIVFIESRSAKLESFL